MIKKVLTTRKIFLFTIIFSVFTSSICTYALKADWITHWTKVNGRPETTPIGADEEYPKIFVEAFNFGGQYFENAGTLLTKSEHIFRQYIDKIDKIVKQRGLQEMDDFYYYNDDGKLIHDITDEENDYFIHRYLLYDDNKQYGMELVYVPNTGYFILYKDESGNYVRDKWMTLDIDFDGLMEWVFFMPNGKLFQWTEVSFKEDTYPTNHDSNPIDVEYPENASGDGTDRTPAEFFYFSTGNKVMSDAIDEVYKINPIGQWVDDNGVVQRP